MAFLAKSTQVQKLPLWQLTKHRALSDRHGFSGLKNLSLEMSPTARYCEVLGRQQGCEGVTRCSWVWDQWGLSTAVEAKLWLSVCSLHPGVDLLCLLSFALQSSTFTIWCEAWIAALFSLSCDRNFYHEHNGEEQERVLHLNNGEPGKCIQPLVWNLYV